MSFGIDCCCGSCLTIFVFGTATVRVTVFVLADMAGRKNLQTTMRYIMVNDEMKRNAAELF